MQVPQNLLHVKRPYMLWQTSLMLEQRTPLIRWSTQSKGSGIVVGSSVTVVVIRDESVTAVTGGNVDVVADVVVVVVIVGVVVSGVVAGLVCVVASSEQCPHVCRQMSLEFGSWQKLTASRSSGQDTPPPTWSSHGRKEGEGEGVGVE